MHPAYKNDLARAWLPVTWIDVRAAVGPQKKILTDISLQSMQST